MNKRKTNKDRLKLSAENKLNLWNRAMNEDDTHALMKLSYIKGMMTKKEYSEYMKIEKDSEN